MAISFHFDKISKPLFFKSTPIKVWLKKIALKEKYIIQDLNYIFLDDEGLLKINMEYLNHDTYTDIITFDNSEAKGKIESDIFISLERVQANAKKFNTTVENELYRVLAHGLLHLCGYKDKNKTDIELMRKKEEEALLSFRTQ
ncbi:MAG TPA: rRNA maturation RNase YbeY [Chitinophagales bacterium]|nr:rRNA maturation RNase YbeY [Chitinophagales bacterium]